MKRKNMHKKHKRTMPQNQTNVVLEFVLPKMPENLMKSTIQNNQTTKTEKKTSWLPNSSFPRHSVLLGKFPPLREKLSFLSGLS